jgi:hypothetical protein
MNHHSIPALINTLEPAMRLRLGSLLLAQAATAWLISLFGDDPSRVGEA